MTANGDRVFIPARGDTGIRSWEISPCLEHHDPHDGESWTEAYETMDEAEDASCEGTGAIFWGVYAHMREAAHSDVVMPTMHIMDFDCPVKAAEFVRAMNGRDGVSFSSEEEA